jgi:glycerol-3-phosphate acyltransferase PlsX
MSPEGKKPIAVDAMGADKGPDEVIAGVRFALDQGFVPEGVVLVGAEDVLQPLLSKAGLANDPRVNTFHASQVIRMDEKPIQSLKEKKDASLLRTVELVKLGTCAAAVSCGNTGALMAGATLRLRPLEGVSKPALASVWPSKDRHFIVLDAGANPQCKPENLVHYAVLGNNFAKAALGLSKPRVGLLSIGTEEGKGTDLTNETHRLLRSLGDQIDYVGLIEGFQLFGNDVDVVVTDGFTGNVVLKTCESLWKMLKGLVKEEVKKNPVRLTGALLLRGAGKSARRRLDPDLFGGAPLLGLRGTVLKAHGSSGSEAIANAIRIASKVVRQDLNAQILEDISRANQSIRARSLQPEETAK